MRHSLADVGTEAEGSPEDSGLALSLKLRDTSQGDVRLGRGLSSSMYAVLCTPACLHDSETAV